MDKAKGGRIKGRRWGWVGWSGVKNSGRKMEATYLNNNKEKKKTNI